MKTAKEIQEAYLSKIKADKEALKEQIIALVDHFLEEKFEDASNGINVFPLEIDRQTFEKMFKDSTIAIRIFENAGFHCDFQNRSDTPSGTSYRFTVK